MPERKSAGENLSHRLASRQDEALHRRDMPDGGSVYTGPLARRALRAVGARAMTVEGAIFVDDDFDPDRPEDQALYAHERVHALGSGGRDDTHGARDAEEVAARAVERMVLHRARAGEDADALLREVTRGGGAGAARAVPGGGTPAAASSEVEAGLASMLAQGLTYDQIVRDLALHVTRALAEADEAARRRAPHDPRP